LSTGLLAGCERVPIGGIDDNASTRSFEYTDFTGIEVGDSFHLDVTYADTCSVTITASDRVMKRVHVSKTGGILKISMDGWWWFWRGKPRATITMPVLQSLDVSGASGGTVSGFKSGNDFILRLSGASSLDIDMETGDFDALVSGASDLGADMKVAKLDCTASGSSTISGSINADSSGIKLNGASDARLAGSTGNLVLSCSGSSSAKLASFSVTDADIDLSGASNADVDVSGKMDVTLSGASSLNYYGNPTTGKMDISGESDIVHKTR
jgi:hypothetical protein